MVEFDLIPFKGLPANHFILVMAAIERDVGHFTLTNGAKGTPHGWLKLVMGKDYSPEQRREYRDKHGRNKDIPIR